VLRGTTRVALSALTSGLGSTFINLTPTVVGDRASTAATIFLRYRFKSVNFKFRSNQPTTTGGNYVMGVIDDTAVTSAALTTPDQMLNLRTHKHGLPYQNGQIRWRPIDRSKWYYCNTESSNDDSRFLVSGVFGWLVDTVFEGTSGALANSPGTIDVDYVIEFAGATNVAV